MISRKVWFLNLFLWLESKLSQPFTFNIISGISFDVADGCSRFNQSDEFTNNNTEQTWTRNESKCQRKASDDSEVDPPSEGFSPMFEPSDEAIEHGLLVAEAATGEWCNKLVSGLIIEKPVGCMLPLDPWAIQTTIYYRLSPNISCHKMHTPTLHLMANGHILICNQTETKFTTIAGIKYATSN